MQELFSMNFAENQFEKPRPPVSGNVSLIIDCSKMGKLATQNFAFSLQPFLKVQIIGGDTIYAEGRINPDDYSLVWKIIRRANCNVIC